MTGLPSIGYAEEPGGLGDSYKQAIPDGIKLRRCSSNRG
jgi:hypothetical protein